MKKTTVVIYVRGEDESTQEVRCKAYANEMGYEVAYVTRYIEDVKLCDVLLVADFSKISRKQIEFIRTYRYFKARGIRIESVTGTNDISELFSAKDIYKALEPFFEKEFNKK